MIIYLLDRRRIPKLRFDGFVKIDGSEAGLSSGEIDKTKFFVKITNVNTRSEGKTKLCMGFITIDNKTHEMLWEDDYSGNSFGKEASLQIFYVDKNQKTINFITRQKQQTTTIPKSYNECIHDNISIRLECERGICPKPLTENIENIINNAECV